MIAAQPNSLPGELAAPWGHAPKIAVVIPCYRVARHVAALLSRIGPEVGKVYCVDDGCPEGSGAVAELSAQADPRVRVLRHGENRGVGAAVVTGYRAALADGAEVIVKLDGDGQMAPEDIGELVEPVVSGEADYAKGNRYFHLADVRSMPFVRLVGNAGLSFLSKLSSGYWNLFDPTNGFTAIDAELAARLVQEKLEPRYFFESDVLFRLYTLRAVVADVPLKARYGEETSNLSVGRTLVSFPLLHLRNLVKRLFYGYFLRDFNPASLSLVGGLMLVAFGTIFGAVHWVRSYRWEVLASPGTVMLAALPVVLGWQALLNFVQFDMANMPRVPLQRSARIRRMARRCDEGSGPAGQIGPLDEVGCVEQPVQPRVEAAATASGAFEDGR